LPVWFRCGSFRGLGLLCLHQAVKFSQQILVDIRG
jgi:hypothetical protein